MKNEKHIYKDLFKPQYIIFFFLGNKKFNPENKSKNPPKTTIQSLIFKINSGTVNKGNLKFKK